MNGTARDEDGLRTSDVAALLRLGRSTVARTARADLPYWTTPRGHRRYRVADVVRYAREHLGRELADPVDTPGDASNT